MMLGTFVGMSMLAAPMLQVPVAKNRGATVTVQMVSTPIFGVTPDPSRHGWCLKSDDGNSDDIRFTLGLPTPSTSNGIRLKPGAAYCDPIGNDAVYTGPVYVIAVTTAATVNINPLAY